MEGTIFSVIPAIVMLVLVLVTRKILLSLGSGIIIGALFINNFAIINSLEEIWKSFYAIFYVDGAINSGNLLLLGFLLLLGMMTAYLQASGGSKAFGEWMIKRVKTRTGAQLMTVILGLIIFIDDYFNSLAVGQVAKPLTDRHNVSRAKLAYLIDSTSAPVTVLSPISSWGAYLIGILGGILATNNITDLQPLEAFVKMIPLNFYALTSLLLVFIVIYFKADIGPMRTHEKRALEKGEVLNPEKPNVPGDISSEFPEHSNGKVYHLLVPIIVLTVVTILSMFLTGLYNGNGGTSIFDIFGNMNVNLSLFLGGLAAVLSAILFHILLNEPKATNVKIIISGCKTMLPAIMILILAWMIGSIISTLQTGQYLANLVTNTNINSALLPLLFFIIACIMSLATGTSWGTFGIMLPIAAEVTVLTDQTLLLPTLAAVLAGSVFGDHCTPISDTTILSSTGAGVNHMDHVMTQMPYAIIAAVASCIGYLIIGVTHQLLLGLFGSLLVIMIITIFHNFMKKTSYH